MLAVTRFNDDTWRQNTNYREKQSNSGCIYGCSLQINSAVPPDTIIYVLEMNNSTNKIMGIGRIKNKKYAREKIYTSGEYNRHVYKGTYRKDASKFTPLETILMEEFEQIVFKGSGHLKRGSGISILRPQMYSHDTHKDNGKIILNYLERSLKLAIKAPLVGLAPRI
jgi:hypothetical protein